MAATRFELVFSFSERPSPLVFGKIMVAVGDSLNNKYASGWELREVPDTTQISAPISTPDPQPEPAPKKETFLEPGILDEHNPQSRQRARWEEWEDDYIRENISKRSVEGIAAHLRRNKVAVQSRINAIRHGEISSYGPSTRHNWTDEDHSLIVDIEPLDIPEVSAAANILGVTTLAAQSRIYYLRKNPEEATKARRINA